VDRPAAPFGRLLREGRQRRGLSQLALALDADVSPRHLSALERGRAEPSRAMVLRLAERLTVPLRERNAWLAAAGFAALYPHRDWADPALHAMRDTLQRLLDAHVPWPALAVDGHWHLVAHNRMVPPLLALVSPALREPPVNVLRLSLHPDGLAPRIENLAAWRAHVLARLAQQARASGDAVLHALHEELRALPGPPPPDEPPAGDDLVVPVALRTDAGVLRFLTTVTVFGAPKDVTLSELAIETMLPADEATAMALRALAAATAG
jgi:transcriptional regulator with XRE-family HTH domain